MVMSSSNSINLSRFFSTNTHSHINRLRKARQTKRIDMCNMSSSGLRIQKPSYLRTRSIIKKTTTTQTKTGTETTTTTTTTTSKSKSKSKSLKPARKSRTKTRKPKFLSLRLELSQQQQQQQSTTPTNSSSINNNMSSSSRHHQLNLFPLHPENMVDDKLAADINDDNNVAFLFHSEGGGGATLNGLLTSTTTTTAAAGVAATTTMSTEDDSISMSYTAAYRGGRECCSEESQSLVRTAMRNRERDSSEEEKWVCYSEVVEKKEVEEETSSSYCAGGDLLLLQKRNTAQGLLSLKLDYEGILNAWSDKGPLYVHGESPQTVPDLQDDKSSNVLMDGLGSAENLWKVPETGGNASSLKMKEEMGGREGWKMGQREASVLRYKEKRQSRLFAKRIRYEVRKLNAEKRPRMKGRFVKRS
ncbi:uncharacterized protein LOC107415240 [Ziziphus jujuba]|uniref:Uncharacterized protein LOC107415240 n=2 Tax=Ziziphus jujuba TaxID=326968 RepID=A0ABM3IGW4_ZIZJJ|nr:uncharacterized protein LOC107415240 [Ziziphus jujuba]